MQSMTEKTFEARIYMAGNIEVAKQVCREECFRRGLCVTVTPTDYIYTGGEESGFVVGLANYPRFPSRPDEIRDTAEELAAVLAERCCQHSFMIVKPDCTTWKSRREESGSKDKK
jgi:hypothetical protein